MTQPLENWEDAVVDSDITPGVATGSSQNNSPIITSLLNDAEKSKNSNSLISSIAAGLGPLEKISTPDESSQEKSSGNQSFRGGFQQKLTGSIRGRIYSEIIPGGNIKPKVNKSSKNTL